jgi:hypothetical protein
MGQGKRGLSGDIGILKRRIDMRINKYLPFAIIFFFFNSLSLPRGLTYTTILSPLFYWWVIKTRKQEIILPFFVCLVPFIVMHIILGVNFQAYSISFLNLLSAYIFCQAFYTFLKECRDKESIFRNLLIINFIFCLVAVVLYFTPYYSVLWLQQFLTKGVDEFRRLKLFTYEPSYYATLFTPLFFFYFLQIILEQNRFSLRLLLPLVVLPFLLSFSLGVISSVLLAIIIAYLLNFKTFTRKKRVLKAVMLVSALCFFALGMLFLFFPGNALFTRLGNVFSGQDLSGRGRTSDSFIIANKLLDEKSHAWGIGLGQVKILGADIIRDYYQYTLDYNIISIPNAAAETLAMFGWIGFSLRLLIELFFFVYTRVWINYFRLLLFIFIFIYQFTGSFITNLAEYVVWILAFTNAFPQFDVMHSARKKAASNSKPVALIQ